MLQFLRTLKKTDLCSFQQPYTRNVGKNFTQESRKGAKEEKDPNLLEQMANDRHPARFEGLTF